MSTTEALLELLAYAQREAGQGMEARGSLDSQRVANAILTAEVEALRAQVDAAVPAMREYVRQNPIWNDWRGGVAEPVPQDPNGAHAWLDRNDAARHQPGRRP